MENNIQFDEPGGGYMRAPVAVRQSFPTRIVMQMGLAKNEQQAQYVLVGVAILAIIGAFFMYPRTGSLANVAPPDFSTGAVNNNDAGAQAPTINTHNINTVNDDLLNF